jgi:hypothetical protein
MQAVGLLCIGWLSSPCPVLAVWTLCHDARLAAVLVLRSPSLQVPSVGGGIGYAGVACMLMCLLDPKMAMLPG